MSDQNWSLKSELSKRKTQEILRTIEAKHIKTPHPLNRTSTSAARTRTVMSVTTDAAAGSGSRGAKDAKDVRDHSHEKVSHENARIERSILRQLEASRTISHTRHAGSATANNARTQEHSRASKPQFGRILHRQSARPGERHLDLPPLPRWLTALVGDPLHWTSRQRAYASAAGLLILMVCMATALAATRQPGLIVAAQPLPSNQAESVLSYMRQKGSHISRVNRVERNTTPNTMWAANEELHFYVDEPQGSGTFILMSYDSPTQAAVDAFAARYDRSYRNWNVVQISNVLLMSRPNTPPALTNELAGRMTQLMIAPYRNFVATATPSSR